LKVSVLVSEVLGSAWGWLSEVLRSPLGAIWMGVARALPEALGTPSVNLAKAFLMEVLILRSVNPKPKGNPKTPIGCSRD
jgi:hypothetical protein